MMKSEESSLSFDLGACLFQVWPEKRICQTVFPDGTRVIAMPEDTDAYRETARDLGYGDDTWEMCWQHELFHTLILRALGHPYSPTLWDVAHGVIGLDAHRYEERRILDFQKLVRQVVNRSNQEPQT